MNKTGQVWIETVLYTLIGLALMGMVLAFAYPKINAAQDRIAVDQTVNAMRAFDQTIVSVVEAGPGNVRIYEGTFKRGSFKIDSERDTLEFVLPGLRTNYSQPGVKISEGRLDFLTSQGNKYTSLEINLTYTTYANIRFLESSDNSITQERKRLFSQAPAPYKFSITNEGLPTDKDPAFRIPALKNVGIITIREISGKK